MSDLPPSAPWLERIAPRARHAWRGRWQTGTVEPWRLLYDHELVICEQGDCRVTIADTLPERIGPLRRDDQGRPVWHAVSGRDAELLAALPHSGTTYDLRAGTFIIIPPAIAHLTRVTRGPTRRACIHFDWLAQGRLTAPICAVPPEQPDAALINRAPAWVPRGVIHGPIRLPHAVEGLIDTFFHRWSTRRVDERLAARGTLLELLVRLLAEADEAQAHAAGELAHAIKDLLDRHLADPRSLPTLLAGLERSYEHCCRLFAATYGVPPLRYLTAERLEQAKHLLAQPELSISAIARTIGYADAAYFSRVFKAHVGCSPAAFRRPAPGSRRAVGP